MRQRLNSAIGGYAEQSEQPKVLTRAGYDLQQSNDCSRVETVPPPTPPARCRVACSRRSCQRCAQRRRSSSSWPAPAAPSLPACVRVCACVLTRRVACSSRCGHDIDILCGCLPRGRPTHTSPPLPAHCITFHDGDPSSPPRRVRGLWLQHAKKWPRRRVVCVSMRRQGTKTKSGGSWGPLFYYNSTVL